MSIRYRAGAPHHPSTTLPSNVTGECPHLHRTPEAAEACIDRHDRAIKRGHGRNAYSDRVVMMGNWRPYREGGHFEDYRAWSEDQ